MALDPAACYRALGARDRRFDGVFFVGVETTGIYCRPICPARTPAKDRCVFFERSAQAEHAGFRACFRCRPELAPGLAPVDSISRLVRQASERIDEGFLDEHSVERLARELGVTSRHLRRSIQTELGVSPVEMAQTRRLALAKRLLHDSALSLADVAFSSGFSSVRRFNASFRETFGRAPSDLRKRAPERADADAGITLRLDYRPPLDWPSLLAFLRDRALPGVEVVKGSEYRRTVALGTRSGTLSVGPANDVAALTATVSVSLAPELSTIVSRLRALFDLDARPHAIGDHLRRDSRLASLVVRRPGLRVPGAFDPFETGVRAVLGQQISVRAARTLAGRLVAAFGRRVSDVEPGMTFPSATSLADVNLRELERIGLPSARARTIVELAGAVAERRIDLSSAADPQETIGRLLELPGVGPWTASYLALRALHWPDAFVAGDLGVKRALGVGSARAAERRAAGWRPWRAYAVMHLWRSLGEENQA